MTRFKEAPLATAVGHTDRISPPSRLCEPPALAHLNVWEIWSLTCFLKTHEITLTLTRGRSRRNTDRLLHHFHEVT